MGKGVGEQHVHVEDEAHAPVGGTVLPTVRLHHTAGGEEEGTECCYDEAKAREKWEMCVC